MGKNSRVNDSVFSKNDMISLSISDIGSEGEGIGKIDGFAFFVKDALPGDEIDAKVLKVKKNYGYAKVERVVKPSPFRIKPECDNARRCGGCQIMEMDYNKQLQYKNDKVRTNLTRIGQFDADLIGRIMEPIVAADNTLRYRNKAQYPIGKDKDGNVIAGFYAGRTHSIISCNDCKLGNAINSEILEVIIGFINEYGIRPYNEETHTGLLRHVLIRNGHTTGEIMVCLVINGKDIPKSEILCDRLSKVNGMTSISISSNTEKTNVIMGNDYRTIWGRDTISDVMKVRKSEDDFNSSYGEGIRYEISPLSFYQVNPTQVEKLYGVAMEYAGLTGNEEVWDICCGIGTITLSMAALAKKVHGIEIVPQAIEDANMNMKANAIDNAEFICAAAEEYLPLHAQDIKADVIVMDPPRKGMEESALEAVVKVSPAKIVYVSCDSATLARDLRYLCDKGYELKRVRAVDMFPQTVHTESVCLLVNKNAKAK